MSQLASAPDAALVLLLPELDEVCTDLRRNPELSMQEQRSAGFLSTHGFEVTRRVAGAGVFGVQGNSVGSTVMLSADIDTLPMSEATGPQAMWAAASAWLGAETLPA